MPELLSDKFLKGQRLLVISPHADDEAFGCAGTIARMKDLGAEVFIMVMSVGDLDHYNGKKGVTRGDTRAAEFAKAAEFLKVDGYEIVFKDPQHHLRLDALPRRELISIIERDAELALDKLKPTMVAIPAISYNQDHVATFYSAFTACRPHDPQLKSFPQIVLTYDNPTLFWNMHHDKFRPNFYIDISDFLDAKLQALQMHASQLRQPPHHCSLENLEHISRMRGHEVSVAAAEAYMILRFML